MLILLGSAGWLLLAAPVASPPPRAVPPNAAVLRYGQISIRERVIVRVPVRPSAPAPQIVWQEKKGPRCMPAASIAGAAVTKAGTVDFVLKGGSRVRAELDDDCTALNYYGGFYLRPTADGTICADRDSVHARSGGECAITRFRKLVPTGK